MGSFIIIISKKPSKNKITKCPKKKSKYFINKKKVLEKLWPSLEINFAECSPELGVRV